MAEDKVHLALFKEDKLDQMSAEALDKLREMGIGDEGYLGDFGRAFFRIKCSDGRCPGRACRMIAMVGAVVGFLTVAMLVELWHPAAVPAAGGRHGLPDNPDFDRAAF